MKPVEPNPEDTAFIAAQEREQIRAPHLFRGEPLLPYSRGARLLYWQVTGDRDKVAYHDLAFLYILTHPRREVCALSDDPARFREVLMDWADTLTDEEETFAHRVRTELTAAAQASEVSIVPAIDPQKKSDAPAAPPAAAAAAAAA